MTRSWRTVWHSMTRNRPRPAPAAKASIAAGRHAGLATTCYCGSAPASPTCCAPHRPSRAVQQQPGGTGWADDEITPEDLRRLPLHGPGDGSCRDPLVAVDGQEAGLGYPANPERQPG